MQTCFEELANSMPEHPQMDELLSYFEHKYVRGRRLPGRGDRYRQALFPPAIWNQRDAAIEGIARTTNITEGWHHSLQSLFLCDHPTLWLFFDGLSKDIAMQKAAFLQSISGTQRPTKKVYAQLRLRVQRFIERYGQSDAVTYLRAIAHLSYS
jgi:hypothetical protein